MTLFFNSHIHFLSISMTCDLLCKPTHTWRVHFPTVPYSMHFFVLLFIYLFVFIKKKIFKKKKTNGKQRTFPFKENKQQTNRTHPFNSWVFQIKSFERTFKIRSPPLTVSFCVSFSRERKRNLRKKKGKKENKKKKKKKPKSYLHVNQSYTMKRKHLLLTSIYKLLVEDILLIRYIEKQSPLF